MLTKYQFFNVLTTVVALTASTSAVAVNKCTSADGKVTYQEAACTKTDRAGTVALPPTQAELDKQKYDKALRVETERLKAESAARAAQKERDDRELKEAIEKSRRETDQKFKEAESACGKPVEEAPVVGMTEDRFLRCTALGLFARFTINRTETAAGVSKQYVIRESTLSTVRYVYVRNGLVTAIQR